MYTLGIETSCDETAVAVVKDNDQILSNIIATQEDLHKIYGGVFPELASRRHLEVILPLVDKALQEAGITSKDVDLIAATRGPGLIGSLLVGINTAKALSAAWNKPFIGVNHVHAHIYASIMSSIDKVLFPSLGVVLSGGHTCIFKLDSLDSYTLLSTTVDDAIGEAFDKVAKLLELPYPGGPKVEQLARKGDPKAFSLKAGYVKSNPLYFSFSGLKTNVLYALKGQNASQEKSIKISDQQKCNLAASFQTVAINDIVNKTLKIADIHNIKGIYFGGGVIQNQALRSVFEKKSSYQLYWPGPDLSLDNAAMIAGLGALMYRARKKGDCLSLKPEPRIAFN